MINCNDDFTVCNEKQLKELQELPLSEKIDITKALITQWYEYWSGEIYCSFSGGKDSTILLHIAREMYPDIEAVFCDTGNEYPDIYDHIRTMIT